MRDRMLRVLIGLICVTVAVLQEVAWCQYPESPIQVVVPYGAGGGSDTFVRTMQKGILEDNLLPQPLVIINQPGGSATIGSRNVKDSRPDGYKILCLHNAIITARLARTVDYGPEAFKPIAMTGELSLVILVREDAPYKNLVSLLEDARDRPSQVNFGANKGAPAYFATLQMEKAFPGADFNIVSADGGADRYSKILGGHLDAGIFSLSEYFDFRQAEDTPPDQNIRALAVLSKERHPAIPNVLCSFEQKVPVWLSNAHYWWAPKETPQAIVDHLSGVLQQAMQNENVGRELKRLRVDPVFMTGKELQERIDETVDRFEASAATEESVVPDFSRYVIWIVVGLLACVVIDSVRNPNREVEDVARSDSPAHAPRFATAIGCFGVLAVYVMVLGEGWSPYWLATSLMVLMMGGLMTSWNLRKMAAMSAIAIVTGVGIQFVFTRVFETVLP